MSGILRPKLTALDCAYRRFETTLKSIRTEYTRDLRGSEERLVVGEIDQVD